MEEVKNTNSNFSSEEEKMKWYESYIKSTHFWGVTLTAFTIIMLIMCPLMMKFVLGSGPNMSVFWKGFLNVAIIYFPTSIIEFLIYVPMLGSGASYLSFITGNLSNLKIPCAINAREIAGTRAGTPENEVISTLSVAVSSAVTILVLALGVLFLQPLQPFLKNPMFTPAFDNVVPALFGALGLKYAIKGKIYAGIPILVSSLLSICIPSLIPQTSVLLIAIGALAIAVAFLFYKKGILK